MADVTGFKMLSDFVPVAGIYFLLSLFRFSCMQAYSLTHCLTLFTFIFVPLHFCYACHHTTFVSVDMTVHLFINIVLAPFYL
jgi:hypothetical protein